MMRPDPRVKAVYLYPKPVDFRKSINGLAALVELDIKVAVFDPVLFVFLNRTRNQVKDGVYGALTQKSLLSRCRLSDGRVLPHSVGHRLLCQSNIKIAR
jgi:hypothetical protein